MGLFVGGSCSAAFAVFSSPLGPLALREKEGKIAEISFGFSPIRDTIEGDHRTLPPKEAPGAELKAPWEASPLLKMAMEQLKEYFSGERKEFTLPLAPAGTAFQKKVWEALLAVPYGETVTYAELARKIGSPKACRAVGGANHRNPIPILIPCHRVIGANGALTGYAGGLEKKRYLLELERNYSGFSPVSHHSEEIRFS